MQGGAGTLSQASCPTLIMQQANAARTMRKLPFRTNSTWLSDDDLIILDVLFDGGVMFRHLRREIFQGQWNLDYTHHFGDAELQHRLRWLCEHHVLQADYVESQPSFRLTTSGGQLWSQERCPIWERFCTERYRSLSEHRTMMSVVAVSSEIRDDFLHFWPVSLSRTRTASIGDYGLISWSPFSKLHVGVAIYDEQSRWTFRKDAEAGNQHQNQQAELASQRSWWRNVDELQKFVSHCT